MKKLDLVVVSLALAAAACGSGRTEQDASLVSMQQAMVVAPDWNCATYSAYLGRNLGDASYSITNAVTGMYSPIDANGDAVYIHSNDGIVWDFASSVVIRAIFVRADVPGTTLGDATNNVWLFAAPGWAGATAGGNIYAADSSDTKYPAKQIEFCFDVPQNSLQVSKTAKMAYEKSFGWYLFKATDPTAASLVLSTGQVIDVGYKVDVGVNAILTGKYSASGKITIHNPTAIDATITSISDSMEGATGGSMNCGQMLPVILAPGADLVCDWMMTLPNGDDRLNTADVVTSGAVQGGTAIALASSSAADVKLIDACVSVSDDRVGALGTVCSDLAPHAFNYTSRIGPYDACGEFQFANTATLVTDTTGTQMTVSVVLPISVPCEFGCTLSQGYWKTHSQYGPAPYDDNWVNVGEDTPFFLSGQTWYGQFGVPASGNAYWQLARQYAAAVLNAFNGASHGSADAALLDAKALFETYTPAQIDALKGSSALRAQFIALAGTLASYNAGTIGPGHCSE